MATAMQERMTENLQKAKSEGTVRVGRIREILQTAMAQTVSEVKAGSGEIGQIAKDAIADAQETEQFSKVKEQYTGVRARFAVLDEKLNTRYGDRYQSLKQQLGTYWQTAKTWYAKTKAEVNVGAPDPVQRMQIAIGEKMAEGGIGIAQKEQSVKAQIAEAFRSKPQ
jgi:hypothetical protein